MIPNLSLNQSKLLMLWKGAFYVAAVAKELKNLVEEQRAMATLGRIYLLQGQSSTDDKESNTSLKAAEKAFMKSLMLCEK